MILRAPVSLALQSQHLRRAYPDGAVTIRRSRLTWIGYLQPTPLSANYKIGIEYELADRPHVQVIDPVLESRNQKRAPHLLPDDCLCLYYHPAREWNRSMILADTIVPWASEWLLHYELWLATGVWSGGGIHLRSIDTGSIEAAANESA
jgi:hypothetical protein